MNADDEEATLRPGLADTEESYLALLDANRTAEAILRLGEDGVAEASLDSLGYRLLDFGRPEQAVAVFRLVVEQYPHSANAYDSLADGLLALDESAAAAEAFRQVLATLSDDEQLPEERKPAYEARARAMIRRLERAP